MPRPIHSLPLAVRTGAAALLLAGLAAAPAQARVRVFFGYGAPYWGGPGYYPPPIYYPPPVYYPPPAYYPPPPPVVYAPPDSGAPGPIQPARSCNAGPYVCPLERPLPAGAQCWCRDNAGRQTFGHAE
ncbi:MAG: hypothetical protein HIU82_13740 [Proteobacteria bacterium]|nr:hypothetical protein [Pseudomonadota bacterium]